MKRGANGITARTVALLADLEVDRPRFAEDHSGRSQRVQAAILESRGFARRVVCTIDGKSGLGFQLTDAGAQLKRALNASARRH